jgi:membrane protein
MSAQVPVVDPRLNDHERQIWELVSNAPVRNLWKVEGVSARTIARRVWKSAIQDRIFGHAAELAFYFLFSLFPTLLCASSILGLAARSAHQIYDKLLAYLALVVPTSALSMVMTVFNEATSASSSRKITYSLIGAVWSASVGVSACQGTLNAVYKVVERRSFVKARLYAIGLTIVLIVTVSLCLASMFGGDLAAAWIRVHVHEAILRDSLAMLVRIVGWILATAFLALSFAVVYYWAPDLRRRRWRWLTPGSAIGLAGWLAASLGFRVYLHFFNTYTVTYGSLGAVIILLMWFYITGLMLLLGAEINSEIEAAAVEARFASSVDESSFDHPIAPAA